MNKETYKCNFCNAVISQKENLKIISKIINYWEFLIKKEGYLLKDPINFTTKWFTRYLLYDFPDNCLKTDCRMKYTIDQEKDWSKNKNKIISEYCWPIEQYIETIFPFQKEENIIKKYKSGLISRKKAIMQLDNCTEKEANEKINKIEKEKTK